MASKLPQQKQKPQENKKQKPQDNKKQANGDQKCICGKEPHGVKPKAGGEQPIWYGLHKPCSDSDFDVGKAFLYTPDHEWVKDEPPKAHLLRITTMIHVTGPDQLQAMVGDDDESSSARGLKFKGNKTQKAKIPLVWFSAGVSEEQVKVVRQKVAVNFASKAEEAHAVTKECVDDATIWDWASKMAHDYYATSPAFSVSESRYGNCRVEVPLDHLVHQYAIARDCNVEDVCFRIFFTQRFKREHELTILVSCDSDNEDEATDCRRIGQLPELPQADSQPLPSVSTIGQNAELFWRCTSTTLSAARLTNRVHNNTFLDMWTHWADASWENLTMAFYLPEQSVMQVLVGEVKQCNVDPYFKDILAKDVRETRVEEEVKLANEYLKAPAGV